MAKKSFQEIDFSPDHNRESKFAPHKNRMPTVKCLCGFEILVVPDLKAMGIAIKNHVAEHKQAEYSSDRLDSLAEFLTEQVLMAASKIDSPIIN
jgi:hypothetical protein